MQIPSDDKERLNFYRDMARRCRAALLNIQAQAERGQPIDHAKLADQCRHALSQ